jgi:flagellar protein FliS
VTPYATAQKAYRDNAVLTATPEQLVVMLYDGARRFLTQAAAAMRGNDLATANERLRRAEAIIAELRSTLDKSAGEIAERLDAIYAFCQRHLMEARFKRDADHIDQVTKLLSELREAWGQVASGS